MVGFEIDLWQVFGTVVRMMWPMFVLLALALAFRIWLDRHLAKRKRQSEPPPLALEEKIARLAALTGEAGKLNRSVQAELLLAQSRAIQLRADAAEAVRLAALNADEREAVASLVSAQMSEQLENSGKIERRNQLIVNSGFSPQVFLSPFSFPPCSDNSCTAGGRVECCRQAGALVALSFPR
jgi:hypothetical protein